MEIADELAARGYAIAPALLSVAQCAELRARFDEDALFRNTVVMERHGYGRGVYRYFGYPLPPLVADLRERTYAQLAPLANAWAEALREPSRYPATLPEFLERCHAAGQTRPTPLMLRYRAGDHNALHRDLYGDLAFPLQMTVLLGEPGADFEGGEFILVEQRPRKQSLAHVVPLGRGDAVVFPNAVRPVCGARGYFRTAFRHGVAEIRRGERLTLGLIYHDAR
ncbi:MAG TPA: 2OG-Fe(II) oxygenase [Candidatus Limnocylindrales bacterium]|nr:2OG-Fe(II) oxygenase [Candidatus Limnocylindrales bacterium]